MVFFCLFCFSPRSEQQTYTHSAAPTPSVVRGIKQLLYAQLSLCQFACIAFYSLFIVMHQSGFVSLSFRSLNLLMIQLARYYLAPSIRFWTVHASNMSFLYGIIRICLFNAQMILIKLGFLCAMIKFSVRWFNLFRLETSMNSDPNEQSKIYRYFVMNKRWHSQKWPSKRARARSLTTFLVMKWSNKIKHSNVSDLVISFYLALHLFCLRIFTFRLETIKMNQKETNGAKEIQTREKKHTRIIYHHTKSIPNEAERLKECYVCVLLRLINKQFRVHCTHCVERQASSQTVSVFFTCACKSTCCCCCCCWRCRCRCSRFWFQWDATISNSQVM